MDSKKLLARSRMILEGVANNWTAQALQDWVLPAALRAHSRAHHSGLLETMFISSSRHFQKGAGTHQFITFNTLKAWLLCNSVKSHC